MQNGKGDTILVFKDLRFQLGGGVLPVVQEKM